MSKWILIFQMKISNRWIKFAGLDLNLTQTYRDNKGMLIDSIIFERFRSFRSSLVIRSFVSFFFANVPRQRTKLSHRLNPVLNFLSRVLIMQIPSFVLKPIARVFACLWMRRCCILARNTVSFAFRVLTPEVEFKQWPYWLHPRLHFDLPIQSTAWMDAIAWKQLTTILLYEENNICIFYWR